MPYVCICMVYVFCCHNYDVFSFYNTLSMHLDILCDANAEELWTVATDGKACLGNSAGYDINVPFRVSMWC